jgi:hypothetical protein
MSHTPVLIVQDEVDTPHMRIIQCCFDCAVVVSEHDIDASKQPDMGHVFGGEDGNAWLKHVAEGKT